MTQSLAELFKTDTQEEDAIIHGDLPDVPVVKQLDDGVVVIGVTGKNSAGNACTVTRSADKIVCVDTVKNETVFDIPLDTPELKEAISFAYSGEKPAIVVFEAKDGGMTVYAHLNFA